MRFKVRIENGKVIGGGAMKSYLPTLKDGDYAFEIKRWTRTLEQNSLYWKWLEIIGEDLGYFKNEMHEVFLDMFAPTLTFADLDNRPKQRKVRSSEMTVKQMNEYMNQIEVFASEHGILLPVGDDQKYLVNNRRLNAHTK